MLLLINQFLLKQAVRSPIYLLNPPVTQQEDISLPRFAVLHYLDQQNPSRFPVKDLYYFKDTPGSKRIPIQTLSDLAYKEDVSTLELRTVTADIRKWERANIKTFKPVDLLEFPNTDMNVVSVFNYNIAKDMYKYKTSLTSKYSKFENMQKTLWWNVKQALSCDNESIHIVPVDIPSSIPSFTIVEMTLKFNIAKLSRVVSDMNLMKVIDIYRWLGNGNRGREFSTMSSITDQDSLRVMFELRYKGHSCFLPLHVIRAISQESELESQVKLPPSKVLKIFLVMLGKIQDRVNGLLESSEVQEPPQYSDVVDIEAEGDVVDIESAPEEEHKPQRLISGLIKGNDGLPTQKQPPKAIKIDDNAAIASVGNFDKLVSSAIAKFEEDNESLDQIYQQSILKETAQDDSAQTQEAVIKTVPPQQAVAMLTPASADQKFEKFVSDASILKTMTSTEIRSLKKLKENREILKSPYEKDRKFDEAVVINHEEKQLTDSVTRLQIDNDLIDEDLKKDAINTFDSLYLKQTYKKDVIGSVKNLENSGLIIKDYTVDKQQSSVGAYEIHKLTVKPYSGKESTVYFRLPVIDSEGTFTSAGVKYFIRKQRTDLPIRKISPTRVALTSNYSKLFVSRTERKVNDPYSYYLSYIRESYLSEEGNIVKVVPGGKILNQRKLPKVYFTLASQFNEVRTSTYTLLLNPDDAINHVDTKVLKDLESRRLVFCGYNAQKHIIVINENDHFYDYSVEMKELGTIEDILGIDKDKTPKPFTIIKVLGDDIPLGICLSYYLGISGLISVTGVEHKLVEANKLYRPEPNEVVLKFSDYKLILKTDTTEKQLLFNGFLFYKDFIKQHSVMEFDLKEIYLNLLEFRESGLIHLKELTMLQDLFLDPITIDVLKDINEPTEFLRLLLRANELLKDFQHPEINDPQYARIRGYDRVPGLMYRALCESIRDYKLKGRSSSKIELDPYKVWNTICQDSTVKITEDANPILDVKESETVTLSGADGLNKDATPAHLRRFHKNDIGLVSEGTVDSSDVALNFYLSPYAKLQDTRGTVNVGSQEHVENPGKVFSTSALLAPMAEQDDAKRLNYTQIQNAHTISSAGYSQPILRTGYEYVMPYKVSKLYCVIAKEDGQVVAKSDKLVTVKYKSGQTESFKIGTQYGRMEGSVYPHSLVCDLQVGERFKQNQHVLYNENFFEKDWLDSSRLVMKFGKVVTVALTMNNEVFEDSSAISKELGKQMSTTAIKEKIFIFDFKKNLVNLLPEGSATTPNTVLFTAVDEGTDYSNLSESTIGMLQNLAALSPKAKYNAVVDRYEIKYNGEVSDMSPSLRKLVTRLDKQLYDETKGTEHEASHNQVNSEYRSEGKNLQMDTLELKVFLKVDLAVGVGDKGVFASQMKSVVSNVFNHSVVTESGTPVDAYFSYKGMLGRKVSSPVLMGTTIRLVKHVSKQLADVYFGK